MKDKLLKLINSQIKEIEYRIRDVEIDFSDYEDIHQSINVYAEMKRLKGSKQTLETMRNIIENMEG